MSIPMHQACDFVLFGAKGDLAMRKLFPALFQLDKANLLNPKSKIIGVARTEHDQAGFVEAVKETLDRFLKAGEMSDAEWQRFAARLDYVQVDMTKPEDFKKISAKLDASRVMVNYLATPPSVFGDICKNLSSAELINEQTRIVLEKPIGHDLASSKVINDTVATYFKEDRIYRIDHYLGKETVQNLLALRFANNLFGSQWHNSAIDHVQITVSETVGLEGRWSYYDKVGQMRDMVQNHLLQLLCMVAMNPPSKLDADSIRDEKVRVLKALHPITSENVTKRAVRGQYAAGSINGSAVVGYAQEDGAQKANSNTETFVSLRVNVDNWRWAGVPFYLRTGKRMPAKMTEIVIVYKNNPHFIFDPKQRDIVNNRLVIRLQPEEGIRLHVVTKQLDLQQGMNLQNRALNLNFGEDDPNHRTPDAYERLLLESMVGDQSLFVRRDEIEASWAWCDQLIDAWKEVGDEVKPYNAGTWGPIGSIALIERDGRSWHE
ncbi:glucose-6-phosphate dehydrogenase [Marinobacterium sp. LSUCC0821]|uniref:glucose-6-phosphate dehydrogenase n=1 Tax=Marinobacterium sp. LSUCC0821 TaxID=2668067 RepID=UPI00145255F2|nr:glucose-6-phosphate dehydrogenase [Marinobacterium sp. LSUCC0821]QJD71048.1 glucose-6-phosphate dehydrogenase [Marinobacterium sp. LSUCC0821]